LFLKYLYTLGDIDLNTIADEITSEIHLYAFSLKGPLNPHLLSLSY
jgi:hypothetical protein